MLKFLSVCLLTALTLSPAVADDKFGLGRPALAEEIAAWDIDILPDGRGLPEGRGNVINGEEVFVARCAACHGDFAEGVDNWAVLAGGFDTLADKDPVKTVGSYWPYLSTVWDYVNRSMPFGAAQTLSTDEVYAITAYILYSNDLVDEDFELSRDNFLDVSMYNSEGFIIDDRTATEYPLWRVAPCMHNCKNAVQVTMRASVLDVTPEETSANKETTNTNTIAFDAELAKAGKKVFTFCGACHKTGEGAKNGIGPHLYKVIGRTIGGVDKYNYSDAFNKAAAEGRVWDENNMTEFLRNPNAFMPKTFMAFPGVANDEDLTALLEYLKSINE